MTQALENGGVHAVGLLQPAQAAGKVPDLAWIEHGERDPGLGSRYLQGVVVAAGGFADQMGGGLGAV